MFPFLYLFAIIPLLGVSSAADTPAVANAGGVVIKATTLTSSSGVKTPSVIFVNWKCPEANKGSDLNIFDSIGPATPSWSRLSWDFHKETTSGAIEYNCPLEFDVLLNPRELDLSKWQLRHCTVGRFADTPLKNSYTFEFKSDPNYLSHCFIPGSTDEVWIECGKEGDTANPKALCQLPWSA